MAFLLAILLGAPLAGCLAAPDCPVPPQVKVLPLPVPASHLATDPTQPWDTLALAWPAPAPATTAYRAGAGWNVTVDRFANATGGPTLERLHVVPGTGSVTLERDWWLAQDEKAGSATCHGERTGHLAWDLRSPQRAATAQPGMGVRILTAGFWENGTLFYTNIKQLHNAPWPRAPWYAWQGSDPLSVYVYDADRGERNPLWSATTQGTPLGAPTNNATVWDYATTIPGFNAALKGLSLNTARVVRVAPADAYTRPGNEAHPLYGAALVFYIKLVAIDKLPCAAPPACVHPAATSPSRPLLQEGGPLAAP